MRSEAAENARRQRLIKLGSAAVFLAIVAVAVAVVVSQSQTSGGDSLLEHVAEVEQQPRQHPAGRPHAWEADREGHALLSLAIFNAPFAGTSPSRCCPN